MLWLNYYVLQKALLLILLLIVAFKGLSQADTLYLENIEVSASPLYKYAAGATVKNIQKRDYNLAEAISTQNSIYFKNYGNGQLSTIAFRGTSASQTSVLWNGIPVNSPTLGQTDFSLWPTFLLDEIRLQYGSGGSLYGSGAIGGTVLLDNTPIFADTINIVLAQDIGSFGNYGTGISTRVGNKKWYSKTKFYNRLIENNFDYPLKGTDQIQTQENAAIHQYGFAQDLYYRPNAYSTVFLNSMAVVNDREVQPTITNNQSQDELYNQNIRIATGYSYNKNDFNIKATLAYLENKQDFQRGNGSLNNSVDSKQYSALVQSEVILTNKLSILSGFNLNHFKANAGVYDQSENRLDVFAAARLAPTNFWVIDVALRQTYNQESRPFTPSISQEIDVYNKNSHNISIQSQLGRSYRLPTLNDRYWRPGGNINLNAENSVNAEVGLNWNYQSKKFKSEVTTKIYKNWVGEWIIWLPDQNSIWSPSNIREVEITGFEFDARAIMKTAIGKLTLGGDYSYTESRITKGLTSNDISVGNQLPYVPFHQFIVNLSLHHKKWQILATNEFNGLRYSTDDNSSFGALDPFNLVNLLISREVEIGRLRTLVVARINNITDRYYETFRNYAMPRRNYLITLTFNY